MGTWIIVNAVKIQILIGFELLDPSLN